MPDYNSDQLVWDKYAGAVNVLLFDASNQENIFYGTFISQIKKVLMDDPDGALASVRLEDEFTPYLIINSAKFPDLPVINGAEILKHEVIHLLHGHISRAAQFPNASHKTLNIAMDLATNSYLNRDLWRFLERDTGLTLMWPEDYRLSRFLSFEDYYRAIEKNQDIFGNIDPDGHPALSDSLSFDSAKQEMLELSIEGYIEDTGNMMDYRSSIPGIWPAGVSEYLSEIKAKKQVNWTNILRRFVRQVTEGHGRLLKTKTWQRPGRRGDDLMGNRHRKNARLLFAIDTSGSMQTDILEKIFAQIRWVWQHMCYRELYFVEIDSKDYGIHRYRGQKDDIEIRGRGGTVFTSLFRKYIKENWKFSGMIFFTDGYATVPDEFSGCDVLWVLTQENDSFRPSFGEIIVMKKF